LIIDSIGCIVRHAATYQLDLITPGNFPWEASSRKQIRQIPNLRMNARGLPQMEHRL
jgi:hypothetical protein